MLSAAGGVARSLVAAAVGAGAFARPHILLVYYAGRDYMQCVRCAAGTVLGAAVGLLTGFANEESDGLLRGALVGAVTGGFVSVDLADSLLRIWTCDVSAMDTRIKRTVRTNVRTLLCCRRNSSLTKLGQLI
jgi:hypothetical protein